MSEYQPQGYDPRQQRPATPPGWEQQYPAPVAQRVPPNAPMHVQQQHRPVQHQASRPDGLTAAGSFWYVLQCVAFGAGYFAKIPAKKAMQDFGMVRMTSAEQFWYVLMCIAFGGGYFAKLPISKALSEMQGR